MKKNLSVRLLFGAALVASLVSCRSEDFLNSHEETPPSKFRVFTAKDKEAINYGRGFKTLLEHYDDIHKVQHTAQAVRNALKNSLETTDEYVEMNIRSQDFTTKTNEKFTLFPLIKDQQVNGIIIAVLKNNETQVEFLKMYPEAENYSEMLKLFREAYLKNTLPQRLTAKANGDCSSDGTPCDTGEVIITMPGAGGGYTGGTWNGDTLPVGGCLPYENCFNPEGGGGGGGGETTPTNNNTPQPPCEKTKALISKPQIADSLNALKAYAQTNTKKERGFQEYKNGNIVKGNANGNNLLEFGIGESSLGTVHTHQPGTIGILAPQDVMTFLEIVRQQDSNSLGNAYSGTVSSSGTYFINFTGTASDLPPDMTDAQEVTYVDNLVKSYRKDYRMLLKQEGKTSNQTLSNIGLEKLFFNLLDNIGLSGKVSLIKEDSGNTSTIQKDSNGNPIPNPC